MTHDGYFEYYQKLSNWDFDTFEIETESLTNWDLYDQLRRFAKPDSKVLDLGTGGGEKLLSFFPDCAEILGTLRGKCHLSPTKRDKRETA